MSHSVSPTITGMSVPAIGQGFMANRHTAIGPQQQLAGNIYGGNHIQVAQKNHQIYSNVQGGSTMVRAADTPVIHVSTSPYMPAYELSNLNVPCSQPIQQVPTPLPRPQGHLEVDNQQLQQGMPTLNSLRATAVDQQLIQARLQELRDKSAPKPQGELLHCCDNLKKKKKVDCTWPQDCAFVGHLRTRLTYKQLNMEQFVLGFLFVQLEASLIVRANMVEYLTEFFQNVCDQGWIQVNIPVCTTDTGIG